MKEERKIGKTELVIYQLSTIFITTFLFIAVVIGFIEILTQSFCSI